MRGLSEDGTGYVKGAPQLSVPPGAFGGTGAGMRECTGSAGRRAQGARRRAQGAGRRIVAQVDGVIGFFAQYLPVFYIGNP